MLKLKVFGNCLVRFSLAFVLLLLTATVSTADPLDNWHWRNPLPQGNALYGISYGNNTFVAVGESGTILTSPDGTTWTKRTSGATNWLYRIAYGNNTFVAVGSDGTVLQSDDMTGGSTSATDNCNVKLEARNSNYYLTVPIVTLSGTTTDSHYNAELIYSATTDNKIWFKITNVAPLADVSTFSNCVHSTLTSIGGAWIMHLVKIDVSGAYLWVDLTYTPATDGSVWFTLTNSGGY